MTPPDRPRARRSQPAPRAGARPARLVAAVLIVGLLAGGGFLAVRTAGFLHRVLNLGNPFQVLQDEVAPPYGSIAWKLQHGGQVNILALGYGGSENDAPWLTDSIMVISLDGASDRVIETSIPRDLLVRIDAFQDGRANHQKINAAFEIGNDPRSWSRAPLQPAFQGKHGPGHLAESVVGQITGLTFDKYVGVDFKAFRDVVDALGGIEVHMTEPLDDCHYPDYHDGYLNHGVPPGYRCPPGAGIHFPAGDYQVNGEQALELARSRDASEPDQATDFGRSRRQQMILSAIRARITSSGGLARAPQLMDALQNDFQTDLTVDDLKALYDFESRLKEGSILPFAVTDGNLASSYGPGSGGSCGPSDEYVLCSDDPGYAMWHQVFGDLFVPPATLRERAPVQLVNASRNSLELGSKVSSVLAPLGLAVDPGVSRVRYEPQTVIYDRSGGRYPRTAAWLQSFFGAQVVSAAGASGAGLEVVMGGDFARRWYGLS